MNLWPKKKQKRPKIMTKLKYNDRSCVTHSSHLPLSLDWKGSTLLMYEWQIYFRISDVISKWTQCTCTFKLLHNNDRVIKNPSAKVCMYFLEVGANFFLVFKRNKKYARLVPVR